MLQPATCRNKDRSLAPPYRETTDRWPSSSLSGDVNTGRQPQTKKEKGKGEAVSLFPSLLSKDPTFFLFKLANPPGFCKQDPQNAPLRRDFPGLPIFPLKTSPPQRDTHQKVMCKTAQKGNIGGQPHLWLGPRGGGVDTFSPWRFLPPACRAPREDLGGRLRVGFPWTAL